MKRTKTYELSNFKALPGEGPGKFEAVVSVFGNVDLQGDRVMPGAFQKTLSSKREKNELIPVIWSHDWLNPDAHIGFVDPKDAIEVLNEKASGPTGGLLVKGTIDVHKPFAKQVFDLLKDRRVKEWSFAYDIIDESPGEDKANELNELDLIEVGPCLKGANPETYTVAAKSAMEKTLERAIEIEDPMKEFLDMGITDPLVSNMMAKTAAEGTYKAEVPKLTAKDIIGDDGSVKLDVHELFNGPEKAEDAEPDFSEIVAEAYEAGLKAALSKPWHVEKRGDQYCVIKDSDGSEVSCHDTQEEADAHVRALYANESTAEADDEKSLDMKWDGPAAMRACSTAGDFRSIAFERKNDSDPDTAAHWTLPHHARPHGPADDGGVSAALGRLNQAGDTVMSKESIRAHLERHQGGKTHDGDGNWIDDAAHDLGFETSSTANTDTNYTLTISTPDGEKIGRTIGAKAASSLKTRIADAIDEFVAEINGQVEDQATEEKTTEPEGEKQETPAEFLARLLGEEN
jgi:HK97 family phage prohead protease